MSAPNTSAQAAQTKLMCFVAASPGVESLLRDELVALGCTGKVVAGGVEVSATFEQLMRLCLQARLAESARVRLRAFDAAHFDVLIDQLKRLPWHAYLQPALATHVSATCHKSRLYHSNAVVERTQHAIDHALRSPLRYVARAEAEQTVYVRIDRDHVEASVDASGDRLHKRGYRTHVGEAPLRETLAAALVRIAGIGTHTRMWDPFCGSGTIALEWLATQQGYVQAQRGFAFEHWPTFKAHVSSLHVLLDALPTYQPGQRHAFGSDVSDKALDAAEHNAQRLGVDADATWQRGDFEHGLDSIPVGSAVISNPPYGKRVGDPRKLLALYRRFEHVLARRVDLRPAVIACGFAPFLGAMTLPWQRVLTTKNGGLPITVLRLG